MENIEQTYCNISDVDSELEEALKNQLADHIPGQVPRLSSRDMHSAY